MKPVSFELMVTLAPATTAPWGSVTVPPICPVSTCANAALGTSSSARRSVSSPLIALPVVYCLKDLIVILLWERVSLVSVLVFCSENYVANLSASGQTPRRPEGRPTWRSNMVA